MFLLCSLEIAIAGSLRFVVGDTDLCAADLLLAYFSNFFGQYVSELYPSLSELLSLLSDVMSSKMFFAKAPKGIYIVL